MKVARQVQVPVVYKGLRVALAYRMDLVVDDGFVIEIKCVESLQDIHTAQLITYLKLSNYPVGLLVNFNARLLKDGLRRFKNISHFIARDTTLHRDVSELERR